MARSGERARNLKKLLSRVADVRDKVSLLRPTWGDLVAVGVDEEVTRIYHVLGGVHEQPRVAPGPWDLQIDEVAIELDEENHFNRYRTLTLDSSVYRRLDHLDVVSYRKWCASRESGCLTYGKYWSTPSSEHEFGPPGPHANLCGGGAPRWKQRAFYDLIKDLSPIIGHAKVARVSIYDSVSCGGSAQTLDGLLRNRDIDQLCNDGWGEAVATRLGV